MDYFSFEILLAVFHFIINCFFMAELETSACISRGRKTFGRLLKKTTKVDLTPMVDLGFLLLTFFILTSTWSRAGTMRIFLPAEGEPTKVSDEGSITVIPLPGNRVLFYEGDLASSLASNGLVLTNYSVESGLGKIIRNKQERMDRNFHFAGGRHDLVVIIKPIAETSLEYLVRCLDEMAIDDVRRYALVDISQDEKSMLKAGKWLN